MTATVILALVVLGVLPFAAALSDLVAEPGALLDVLGSSRILSLWGATLLLGVTTALTSTLVGVPVARLLARTRGWASSTLATLLPLPLILPPWIAGVAWSQALPLSGFWGAVFLLTASLWPLVALFALRGFRLAGRSAEVGRLVRGAGPTLRAIELPLALPSILSGALLVFVFTITDFSVVDFLSFGSPEPFVVLSSEIFQKWSRLGSSAGAAAVSVPTILPSLLALAGVLVLERRHLGHARGQAPTLSSDRTPGPAGTVAAVLVTAAMVTPVVVLASWAVGHDDPAGAVATAASDTRNSVLVAAAAAAIVAALGVAVARLASRLPPRRELALLSLALLPLAAPGVMFSMGEIRFWNHAANPLADLLYTSPVLLVLALSGRYVCLGVLAARALLQRVDESPFQAARLTERSPLQRWWRVELPLLAPATGLAFALGYLLSMRELDMILMPAGSATLAHRIFAWVHIAADDETALLCLLLIALVIVPAVAARLLGVPGVDCGSSARRP